ncbi:MAG: hypothetical protein KAW12_00360 [Candidatus Aminicenantes bacterium]|nr:hypothetical protein [Candidatus Aminicenantes bacterium]
MKKLMLAVLLCPALLFSSSNFKFEKELVVPPDGVYKDNVISFGGSIEIKGKLEHTLILINGTLKLSGEVGEDIICFFSQVEIAENARVKGDLFVIGGKMTKAAGVKIGGDSTYFRFDMKKIESTLIPFLADARSFTFFKTLKIILWFIITLIVFAVIPHRINSAEEIVEKYKLKIVALGLVAFVSFLVLLILFVVMFFILIGIPLLFGLFLIYFAAFIFGRTVIFFYIGNKIAALLKLKNLMPSLFILLGAVFYALLQFIPIAGPVVLLVINLFEVGIGVGYIFRKKLGVAVS